MSDTSTEEKLTGDELNARAAELGIEGRGSMSADEKREAIREAEGSDDPDSEDTDPDEGDEEELDDQEKAARGETPSEGPIKTDRHTDLKPGTDLTGDEQMTTVAQGPNAALADVDLSMFSSHIARDTTALQNEKYRSLEPDGVVDDRSTGNRVMMIQAGLASAGYHVQVDGQWGRQTTEGVARFQADNGLDETGVVDSATAAKISEKSVR